jgi:hypothetical protein
VILPVHLLVLVFFSDNDSYLYAYIVATYSLRPKKNVILEILTQIIKEVKWPQLSLFICQIRACLGNEGFKWMEEDWRGFWEILTYNGNSSTPMPFIPLIPNKPLGANWLLHAYMHMHTCQIKQNVILFGTNFES